VAVISEGNRLIIETQVAQMEQMISLIKILREIADTLKRIENQRYR
jgi:hypothetical protein